MLTENLKLKNLKLVGNFYRGKSFKGHLEDEQGLCDGGNNQSHNTMALMWDLNTNQFTLSQMKSVIKDPAKYSILDVGCSKADIRNFLYMWHLYVNYYGIEARKAPLLNLKQSKNTTFIQADIRKLDRYFKKESFDFVLFTEVLEHLTREDGIKTLMNIYSVLKKDGKVLLTTPSVFGKGLNKERELKKLGHIYFWGSDELTFAAKKIGFKVDLLVFGKYPGARGYRAADLLKKKKEGATEHLIDSFGKTVAGYLLAGMDGEEAGHIKMVLRRI